LELFTQTFHTDLLFLVENEMKIYPHSKTVRHSSMLEQYNEDILRNMFYIHIQWKSMVTFRLLTFFNISSFESVKEWMWWHHLCVNCFC